ncbi:ATP-grasp domain-containing protein [Arthrobacter koreensis]|uniref:hypothetical protein n=1 Tax=Arthrobacter koreensis TaxID=199136 RepID=UPI0037F21DFC
MLTATAPRLLLEFSGSYPAPMPSRIQHENTALLGQYLNSWTRIFGELNHQEDGDFENFVETMARFDAASRAFGYQNTSVMHRAGKHLSSLCDFHGAPLFGTDVPDPDFVFGPVYGWGDCDYSSERDAGDAADRYWQIPAFRELSGRTWAVAGFLPDDPRAKDVLDVLREMFDDGVRDFVVKGLAPKSLLVRFTLTRRPESLFGIENEIPSELTDGCMHLEGQSEVFLVQKRLQLVNEYRMFMAGPNPVAGAGCIEKFTPLDAKGPAFDVRVEGVRGSDAISEEPLTVGGMLGFAYYAGALLHEQKPELGAAWVMDLAVDAETGDLVVIELNPARNSGLYASSPSAWMEGVRDHLAARG